MLKFDSAYYILFIIFSLLKCKYIISYLFNCACLAAFLAVFNLRETLLHDSSVAVTFCMHDADKAAVLVSSSDKLSSER